MRGWSRKVIALIALAVFLASFGASGFSSARLAHDLDHDGQTVGSDHYHLPPLSIDGNSDPEPLSDVEHRLLHAVSNCEPFPGSAITILMEPYARTIPTLSSLSALPPVEPESPFRPPRTPTLI